MPRMAIGDDEKKKLMVLGGLLIAILVVVAVLYNPFGGGSSDDEVAQAPTTNPGGPAGTPAGDPGATPAAGAGATAPAPGGITAASLVSLDGYRPDPFQQFILPQPPPPPPPPVAIPQPVEILPPNNGGYDGIGIPPMGVGGSGSRPLALLPPIVPRRVATAPTAPRVAVMPGGDMGTGGGVLRAQNKRLSGVVIGDSVRALLEVTVGDKITTRVVQPGDEVDGIRILRLERVVEAGQTITRLVVRENNQEQFVELRPAPQQQAAGGIEGLVPGGMPGAPPF